MEGDTEHDMLVRLSTNIQNRLLDGRVGIMDLLDWWTRILNQKPESVGWKVYRGELADDYERNQRV